MGVGRGASPPGRREKLAPRKWGRERASPTVPPRAAPPPQTTPPSGRGPRPPGPPVADQPPCPPDPRTCLVSEGERGWVDEVAAGKRASVTGRAFRLTSRSSSFLFPDPPGAHAALGHDHAHSAHQVRATEMPPPAWVHKPAALAPTRRSRGRKGFFSASLAGSGRGRLQKRMGGTSSSPLFSRTARGS